MCWAVFGWTAVRGSLCWLAAAACSSDDTVRAAWDRERAHTVHVANDNAGNMPCLLVRLNTLARPRRSR